VIVGVGVGIDVIVDWTVFVILGVLVSIGRGVVGVTAGDFSRSLVLQEENSKEYTQNTLKNNFLCMGLILIGSFSRWFGAIQTSSP